MSAHTSGPWEIGPRKNKYRALPSKAELAIMKAAGLENTFEALSVGTDRSGQVAIIPLDESNEANARLIAAAPDLLAALEGIIAEWDKGTKEMNAGFDKADERFRIRLPDPPIIVNARAAIAKAEGKP